jgi:hypothetical protein
MADKQTVPTAVFIYLFAYLHGLGTIQAPRRQTARSQHGSLGVNTRVQGLYACPWVKWAARKLPQPLSGCCLLPWSQQQLGQHCLEQWGLEADEFRPCAQGILYSMPLRHNAALAVRLSLTLLQQPVCVCAVGLHDAPSVFTENPAWRACRTVRL